MSPLSRAICRVFIIAALLGTWIESAKSQPADNFYEGKTIKLVIGAGVGGEYGLYAQLIAHHFGRFVRGAPTIVVESMPGAGGRRALNYLAKVAARDGTVLAVPHSNLVFEGLLNTSVKYDPKTIQWVGRLKEQVMAGIVWRKRSGVSTLADAKSKVLVAGGTGPTTAPSFVPRILNAIAGTRFKIVSSYRGTNEVQIAWERGEVDVLTTPWDTVIRRFSGQIESGKIVPIYAHGNRRVPGHESIPLVNEDLGRSDAERSFLRIYASLADIGRSLAAPPGVPAQRVAMLREAFVAMVNDPAFKAATKEGRVGIDPLDGDALAAAVAKTAGMPANQVAQAREFYGRLLAAAKE